MVNDKKRQIDKLQISAYCSAGEASRAAKERPAFSSVRYRSLAATIDLYDEISFETWSENDKYQADRSNLEIGSCILYRVRRRLIIILILHKETSPELLSN